MTLRNYDQYTEDLGKTTRFTIISGQFYMPNTHRSKNNMYILNMYMTDKLNLIVAWWHHMATYCLVNNSTEDVTILNHSLIFDSKCKAFN